MKSSITTIRDIAQKAGSEATAVAENLYSRAQQTGQAIGRQAEARPSVALLVAGALGLLVGYVLRGSRGQG